MDVININLLNQYKKNFETEMKNFKLNTYKTFKNSYIYKCNDEKIKLICNELDKIYNDIENSYRLIDKFFQNYLNDASSLELYLSNKGKIGVIKEGEIRNYLDFKFSKIK